MSSGLVRTPDPVGTCLTVVAEVDGRSGLYKVYIDGRYRLIWTPQPDRWWTGPLAFGSYPARVLLKRLAADLDAAVLTDLEFLALRRHGYGALIKERMV